MLNEKSREAIRELLVKMADDQLILGHRNSEWTGIGPFIEEDIAFGSLAQDKVGQAYMFYSLLHDQFGENDPDNFAFGRIATDYKCCHLVEHPIGEYEWSLVRHFLFDHAELLRFDSLSRSSFEPLAQLARKFKGEIKYHVFHANTWFTQLAGATEESKARIQSALNEAFPLALGIFEPGPSEELLQRENIFEGEESLGKKWLDQVTQIVNDSGLKLPTGFEEKTGYGGRKGYHTEYLAPMLEEMGEVIRIDPKTEW
ncbi:MAG: phenylacetate-CoA oxygenase subunit PaaC [Bacteroidota bacterium]|nr:phenylacetate-CoA oxygenase subunit PaaC [Bacteroidota bacterium]